MHMHAYAAYACICMHTCIVLGDCAPQTPRLGCLSSSGGLRPPDPPPRISASSCGAAPPRPPTSDRFGVLIECLKSFWGQNQVVEILWTSKLSKPIQNSNLFSKSCKNLAFCAWRSSGHDACMHVMSCHVIHACISCIYACMHVMHACMHIMHA